MLKYLNSLIWIRDKHPGSATLSTYVNVTVLLESANSIPSHLLDLFDLLVEAADHLVGGVRDLLHHHEGDERVHLVGQDLVERVAVVTQSHSTVRGHVVDVDVLVDVHHKLA